MLESIISMATNLSSLSIFAVTLGVIYCVKSWLSHPSDLPPMPSLPVPILGHTLFIKPTPTAAFHAWRQKVGDVFTFYSAGKPNIVINSYDLLIEAFVKQADYFSDRPVTVRERLTGLDKGHGIVANSREPWKQQRSVSMAILRSFGMGRNLMAEKISEEVDFFVGELSAMKGEARDLHTLTNSAVSNVICAMLLGNRFDYSDPLFLKLIEYTRNIFTLVGPGSLLHPFPFLIHLPGDLFQAKLFQRSSQEFTRMLSDDFIRKFRDTKYDTSSDNYIKAYLREMDKRQSSDETNYLDEPNLQRNIGNLFLAGTETTSTTILWAFVFALNYPDTQDKIFHEIEEAVGCHRVPSMQDKPGMNYLNAFIMETQRLGSIAPLGLRHKCSRTTQLGGYTIPEGALIIPNLDAVMKDPSNWTNPQQFRPERFLDDQNKLVSDPKLLPFSLGRRVCLGESLAKMELFLFLSTVFQRFRVLPEKANYPPAMEGQFGVTVAPKPFRVRFEARI